MILARVSRVLSLLVVLTISGTASANASPLECKDPFQQLIKAPVAARGKGLIVILSAPSGGGKTTIADNLIKRLPNGRRSVSLTTRAPRGAEVNGVDYHFVSKTEFEKLIKTDAFVEFAEVHGNYYGTTKSSIQDGIDQGEVLFLIIDYKGAAQIKKSFPEAMSVFVNPPDMKTLEARLRGRGTDTDEVIAKRLKNAQEEMTHAPEFDHQIVNDQLDRVTTELQQLVEARVKP